MNQRPPDQMDSRMLLLDNRNEFGYLDAVRRIFATGPPAHPDLTPDDLGLGPYDSLFRAAVRDDPNDYPY